MGRLRAAAVSRAQGVELLCAADLDASRLANLPAPRRIRMMVDYREMLAIGEVDAVVISLPTHQHEEAVMAALDAGKHVMCEKPLSNTVASCRRLVEFAAHCGKTLAVGFNHRYFRSIRYLKNVLDSGGIGTLDHLRVFGGHEGMPQLREKWMYESAMSGGGAMMDIGIHLTDLIRHIAGEVVGVYGMATNRVWKIEGSEDNAIAIFKMQSGAVAQYHATWDEWKGYRFVVEAYGTKGMMQARYAPMMNLSVTHDGSGNRRRRSVRLYPAVNIRERLLGWTPNAIDALAEEMEDFARMVAGLPAACADGVDGLRAVEIANAVYESARSGREIRVLLQP
jgi:predicted dehydrogenase